MSLPNHVLLTEVTQQDEPTLNLDLKHELLKELEPEVLQRIKKGFDLYKGIVKLSQFIAIMTDALLQLSNWRKQPQAILTFTELFLLIDLNHRERIKFQEFTNYLIEREDKEFSGEQYQLFPAERLDSLELQAEKVFPLPNSEELATLDSTKKVVSILQKKTYKCLRNLTNGGKIVNSVAYIPKYEVYCLATNDKFLSFTQSTEYTLIQRFILPDAPVFLLVLNAQDFAPRLIAGSNNGHLYEFNLKKILAIMDKNLSKEEELKRRSISTNELYKHFLVGKVINNQPDLTCLSSIESVELLITGSNDSKVRLYEMREQGVEQGLKLSKELEGHYKGIKGIAVSVQFKLIISCSFDFDILVWNAYLQHPVARLLGHQAPLMNVACPRKHNIIISLDSKAIMKIWSSQNYQLLQNLVIFENFPANSSVNFVYKNESSLAIIYTKKLKFYQYIVNYNPKLTDDTDITAIKYSPQNLSVYIGAKKALKIWSIKTGLQTKVYRDIVNADISILEIDGRERRCFVGTVDGEIVAVDIFSGVVTNHYSSHTQQISMLICHEPHKLLVSGGWDRRLKIHNDTQHLQKIESRQNVLRNIYGVSQKDLQGGSFSSAQLLIATYCKTSTVRLWDFEKGFLEAQITVANEIILTSFIDPLPLLLVVDVKGTIYLFSTKYLLKKPYTLLAQWKNMYSIQKSSLVTCVSYSYSKSQCELVLGDEYGYVRIVNITQFIADIPPVLPEIIGNKNPFRIEDYHYTQDSNANTHDFSHAENGNIIPPKTIQQRMQLKAHADRVNYVTIVKGTEPMLLTAGSDNLVKLWSQKGELKGVMRQGLKENKGWSYETSKDWLGREKLELNKIKKELDGEFAEYFLKKRMEVIPFAEEDKYEEANNEEIYKDLKEVEGYLQQRTNKSSKLI